MGDELKAAAWRWEGRGRDGGWELRLTPYCPAPGDPKFCRNVEPLYTRTDPRPAPVATRCYAGCRGECRCFPVADELQVEQVAKAMQTRKREQILERIRAGKVSASMSGIEYYPPWDEADEFLRKPYLEDAQAAIAALEAVTDSRSTLAGDGVQVEQIVAELRDLCRDWNGEQIVDESTPRLEPSCGLLRRAADALATRSDPAELVEVLKAAREFVEAIGDNSYMPPPVQEKHTALCAALSNAGAGK
jgi:hypothetical protein